MFDCDRETIPSLVSIGKQIHFSIDSIQILPVQCAPSEAAKSLRRFYSGAPSSRTDLRVFHKSRMGVLLGLAALQDRSTLGCVGGGELGEVQIGVTAKINIWRAK